jgi:hypothetical protein
LNCHLELMKSLPKAPDPADCGAYWPPGQAPGPPDAAASAGVSASDFRNCRGEAVRKPLADSIRRRLPSVYESGLERLPHSLANFRRQNDKRREFLRGV